MSISTHSGVEIQSVEALNHTMLQDLTDDMKRYQYINIITDEYDDKETIDEMLSTEDYVKAVVLINGIEYLIYHGFPGDNPAGILIDPKTRNVLTCFGEVQFNKETACSAEDKKIVESFLEWYAQDPDGISCNMLTLRKEDEPDQDQE